MMDANANLTDHELTKFVRDSYLYDIIGNKHGHNQPQTYIRGTKTIDYMFGTKRVLEATRECGIVPFHEILHSDHCAIYIDIDIPFLLKGVIHYTPKEHNLVLHTKQMKRCKQYREKFTQQIKSSNLYERLQNLHTKCMFNFTPEDRNEFQYLD